LKPRILWIIVNQKKVVNGNLTVRKPLPFLFVGYKRKED